MSDITEPRPSCFYCEYSSLGYPCRDQDGTLKTNELVDALLVNYRADDNTPLYEKSFWAFECMENLVRKAPETAFGLIILALKKCKNNREIAVLAAGPLEDLVCIHGQQMIGPLEREAKSDENFRLLLSGIWGETHIDPLVWQRIQAAVRNGPWIDDDPRTPQGSDELHRKK